MAVIISSGTSTVSSGMILSSPSIISAGSVWVTSGGKVVSANVYSSGHENIYSGGIDSRATVSRYGSMRVALSGSAVSPTVGAGGTLIVDEGAVRSAVVLESGSMFVSGRSSAAGITHGYAYNTVVSGGFLFVNQYATISGTQIGGSGYVSLCGVAESTTIGLSGLLNVSSGGKASNTVISSGGTIWVYSGGTANNNRVSAGGFMHISPSGFAYNNYISSGVELNVNHDGIVLSTTVYDGGRVLLYSGGFASETTLSSGTLVVNKSATADMVTVYNGGFVVFSSGATGSGIKENGGYVNVQSGANVRFQGHSFSANITHDATVHKYTVASAATVYSGGRLNVLSGGEATSVFANFSGTLNVSSGGRAMNTTVNNSGTLNLSSGGTADYTLVNNGGTMNFYDGGRDHRTTVSGTLNVSSGGTASNTTVFGKANVFSDGVMSSATVSSGGTLNVSSGGSAVRTTTFGTMLVGYRGIASRVNVVSNGSLVVSLGGKVTGELSFASGGSASFQSGGILDFDITSRTSTTYTVALVKDLSLVTGTPTYTLTVKDDQTEASYVLAKNAAGFNKTISVVNAAGSTLGTLTVGSTSTIGGLDYTLSVDADSVLSVMVGSGSGGSGGSVITGDLIGITEDITSGMLASGVNIYSSGILNISSGGSAEDTAVYSNYSELVVWDGGKATDTTLNSDGLMTVSRGGFASQTTINEGGRMDVESGGRAVHTDVNGYLFVEETGSISGTTVKKGGVVLQFGSSLDTTISSGGTGHVNFGFASATTIHDGGMLFVSSGAAQEIYMSGGSLYISSGSVFNLNMYGGTVRNDCLVSGGMIAGGTMEVGSFNSAVDLFVSGGEVNVAEQGHFNGTITGSGVVRIGSAAEVYSTTVMDGGKITGNIQVNRDSLAFGLGGILDFDIRTLNNDSGVLVTNYSLIEGTPNCTLTVSDTQANGTFMLATSAAGFDRTITVKSAAGATLGTLTVGGESVSIGDKSYTLALSGSLLTVTVDTSVFTGDLINETKDITLGMRASSVNILSSGVLNVYARGTAEVTTVNSGGVFNLYNDGTANDTVVNSCGSMYVGNGGHVLSTVINDTGALFVEYGGVAVSTTIAADGGYMCVSNGGRAVDTVAEYTFLVYDGGSASNTTVKGKGWMDLGGSSINAIILSGGTLEIAEYESSAFASATTILDGGRMIVGNGTAQEIYMSGGSLYVSSGSVFNLNMYGGTVQNDCLVSGGAIAGGTMEVGSFASAVDLFVSGGEVIMGEHGYFNGTITGSGVVRIGSAAEVYNTTVMDGGRITGMIQVNRGGLSFGMGGILDFDISVAAPGNEALVTNYSLISGTPVCMLTVSASQANGTYNLATGAADFDRTITVVDTADILLGTLTVGSTSTIGGKDYTLNLTGSDLTLTVEGGSGIITGDITDEEISVSSGMFAHDVIINEQGILNIKDGGEVSNAFINYGGSLGVSSGGVGSGITVNQDGLLHVYSGGVATGIKENGGTVIIPDDYAPGTFLPNTITGLLLEDSYWLFATVHSGTVANMTTIEQNGTLIVYSGGVANHTPVYDGGSLKLSGGTANQVFVSEGASFDLCGGSASEVFVYEGGTMVIKNGLAEGVETDGALHVSTGGSIIGFTMSSGTTVVEGTIEGGSIEGGTLEITNSGSVTGLTVSGGDVSVGNGGWFNGTVLDGGAVRTESTAVMNGVTVESGGKITGSIYLYAGIGSLSFLDGGILDFDISGVSPWSDALVNDLSLIGGTPDFTLTVSDSQVDGTYSLAGGASAFSGTITVKSFAGANLGTLTVGQTTTILGKDYTLNLNADPMTGDVLTVTVGGEPVPPTPDWIFFNGDFNGDGFAMLAVETPEQAGAQPASVTIYQNGEAWGLGITLDPGWSVVGTGDFNADGKDDFLRVNGDGYVVGEMSNGNGTFSAQVLNLKSAGWDILGTGDFSGNGSDDVLIANPTGASDTVGLLGYWESGVTWTLINGYSAEWECVSTGDFNGDGKCDMLWKNQFIGDGGGTYNAYCTWIVENAVDWRMVSVANPDEWNFLCSGDFDGNGSHDIAMINDVGVVGIWGVNDGYLSSWSILSAVTSEWQLAGVADFNADGTDDIAWANTTTGLTGYWQINDKNLTTWTNLATIS